MNTLNRRYATIRPCVGRRPAGKRNWDDDDAPARDPRDCSFTTVSTDASNAIHHSAFYGFEFTQLHRPVTDPYSVDFQVF